MAAIAGRIADAGANIDRIERMARYPVTAIDLHVSGADPDALRTVLAAEAAAPGRRRRRPARQPAAPRHAADRDGRRLHADPGRGDRDARRARRLRGRGRARSPRPRCAASSTSRSRCARGSRCSRACPRRALDEVYDAIVLAPGARTLVRTLRRLGYRFAIVSGGFSQITDRLAADLGIHFARANELEIVDGRLTGRIVGDVVDRAGKAARAARVRRRDRRRRGRDDRDRRRRQRPRHAQRRRARHRLQRQAGGPRRRRHRGQRALPRRDHVPARHLPRGDRGRRRRGRHRHPRSARSELSTSAAADVEGVSRAPPHREVAPSRRRTRRPRPRWSGSRASARPPASGVAVAVVEQLGE